MPVPTAPPRPRQVTLAAWLIMLGSVFVVLTVFERITGLQSLETQASVQRFLSEPPGDSLGLGVQGVIDLLRVLAMVAAGCATAAAVLGYQVLQRSRSARLALTVLAAPLFLTGMVAGGFMSSIVVAAAVMLWFQPARDWFDGVTREATRAPDPEPPKPVPTRSEPRPFAGFGSAPTSGATGAPGAPAPGAPPLTGYVVPPPPAARSAGGAAARPAAVTWACLLTWAFASLAIVVMATSIVVFAVDPDIVLDELHRQNPDLADQGVSDDLLVTLTFVIGAVVIVWSLFAIVVAALTFRRVPWARVALIVSASVTAALCLLFALGQVLMVVPAAAAIATLGLLVRPDIRAWFRR